MRWKIIAVNALIVALVGIMSFWLTTFVLRASSASQEQTDAELKYHAQGASARLQLESLREERWLMDRASDPSSAEPFLKGTAAARGEAATQRCNSLLSEAKASALFGGNPPTFAALVDPQSRTVGRNGTHLQRGDDLGPLGPQLKAVLDSGRSGSDLWTDRERMLVSIAPVRDDKGKLLGALIMGRPLSDILTHMSEPGKTGLVIATLRSQVEVVAKSAGAEPARDAQITESRDLVARALEGQTTLARFPGALFAAAPLDAIGDGRRGALIVALAAPKSAVLGNVGLGILGATALGLVLVVLGGTLLGSYITRPIDTLEEGLLAVLNGQNDLRFELNHAELGGLAFRVDQLLNKLTGVEEDTTDAEGRVSLPNVRAHFPDALAVDHPRDDQSGPDVVDRLARESEAEYLDRLYRAYIRARESVGEPVAHITREAFDAKIGQMQEDASRKAGSPVRYEVELRDREIVLIAIPLPAAREPSHS